MADLLHHAHQARQQVQRARRGGHRFGRTLPQPQADLKVLLRVHYRMLGDPVDGLASPGGSDACGDLVELCSGHDAHEGFELIGGVGAFGQGIDRGGPERRVGQGGDDGHGGVHVRHHLLRRRPGRRRGGDARGDHRVDDQAGGKGVDGPAVAVGVRLVGEHAHDRLDEARRQGPLAAAGFGGVLLQDRHVRQRRPRRVDRAGQLLLGALPARVVADHGGAPSVDRDVFRPFGRRARPSPPAAPLARFDVAGHEQVLQVGRADLPAV